MRTLHEDILSLFNQHIIDYPTPRSLNYLWSFGSLSGICLTLQIITGIWLSMHYTAHISLAFASVEHIQRNVNGGWFFRYLHANGASVFFILIYIHMARGLYFKSYLYPRTLIWLSGVVIFLLLMATAFMGYVLVWGQMSFWGATVISNLFTAIPIIGEDIAYLLWGGFSVDNPTLNRFFSLHFLLPFLIIGLVILHLFFLHSAGSSNPLGVESEWDRIPFFPYFYIKDLLSFLFLGLLFSSLVFFWPNLLGHPDNYIPADPLVTPPHIVPEWYFLPFYAILRSIPDKLGGVLCMFAAILSLALLPFINTEASIASTKFTPIYRVTFWSFGIIVLVLGWLGAQPVEVPYIGLGQIATLLYFMYFAALNEISYLEYLLIYSPNSVDTNKR